MKIKNYPKKWTKSTAFFYAILFHLLGSVGSLPSYQTNILTHVWFVFNTMNRFNCKFYNIL